MCHLLGCVLHFLEQKYNLWDRYIGGLTLFRRSKHPIARASRGPARPSGSLQKIGGAPSGRRRAGARRRRVTDVPGAIETAVLTS